MDSIVNTAKVLNWIDSINYEDKDDHYIIKIFHSSGINNSIIYKAIFENLFEEYGAKIEADMSENSLFVQVIKNTERK